MSILIIEDDLSVQRFLRENLEPEFSPVQTFSEFPDEMDLQNLKDEPKVIILDRLLRNFDSKDGLLLLRKKLPRSPIIILSAINNPAERAELLDLGADDYMGKPFSIMELKARVRVLTRRSNRQEQTQYLQIGSTILDLIQRTLSVGEKRVNLSAKEFELFAVFAKSPGRVFSKIELLDKVWQANLEIESNVLEVTVMNLRKKLLDIGSSILISSKRNIGYWIET